MKLSQVIQTALTLIFILTSWILPTAAKATEQIKLYIVQPLDGETVGQTFVVKFALEGMALVPAGIDKPDSGHHHLLIDSDKLPLSGVAMGKEVKHFGKAQTETEITLPPGKHTLQLVLGDHAHRPHSPVLVSKRITITVRE